MLKPYQKKIVELLIKQELLLSKLYKTFADKFPKHKDFWINISKAEIRHANWIEKLYEVEKKGIVIFDEGKIKTYTMKAFIEHVEKIISRTENNEINPINTFSYALDFEMALIEKNIFTHFDGLNEKAIGVLKALIAETKNHIEKIKEMKQKITLAAK